MNRARFIRVCIAHDEGVSKPSVVVVAFAIVIYTPMPLLCFPENAKTVVDGRTSGLRRPACRVGHTSQAVISKRIHSDRTHPRHPWKMEKSSCSHVLAVFVFVPVWIGLVH